MAIKGKRNIGGRAQSNSSSLKNEALFVATKLQQATYKGEEFETYQKIMLKLKGVIDKG